MPLNILHVISAPASGGAEIYVKDLLQQLSKSGHKCYVAFLERATDCDRSASFEAEFLSILEASGIEYFFIGRQCRRQPWRGIIRVQRFVEEHGIDIYHSHLPYGALFGASLSIPRVYTHHSIKPRLGRLAYWLLNNIVDQYVGISDICGELLATYTGKQVATIHNGVDGEKFTSEVRSRLPGEKLCALMVGRIHPHKNLQLMVDAVSSLPQCYSDNMEVWVAGEGCETYTEEIRQYIYSRKMQGIFTLLGNRTDIPELMSRSHCFFMSSEREGFPIALLEASMAGLPCIATDVGGCSEVLTSCKNGIIVAPGDVPGYASAIRTFHDDTTLVTSYSRAGIANAGRFSIYNSAKNHTALYAKLLRGKTANLPIVRAEDKQEVR